MNNLTPFAVSCLGILALMVSMALVGGLLVTIVLGYFGIDFTLWQGVVTAFTVSLLVRPTGEVGE